MFFTCILNFSPQVQEYEQSMENETSLIAKLCLSKKSEVLPFVRKCCPTHTRMTRFGSDLHCVPTNQAFPKNNSIFVEVVNHSNISIFVGEPYCFHGQYEIVSDFHVYQTYVITDSLCFSSAKKFEFR